MVLERVDYVPEHGAEMGGVMRPAIRNTLGALPLALLMVAVGAIPSSANHLAREAHRWRSNSYADYTLETYFTSGFPGGAWRDRVQDGAAQWNGVTEGPSLSFQGSDISDFNPLTSCAPNNGSVTVHWHTIADALGQESYCYFVVNGNPTDQKATSSVEFNKDDPVWYNGTGDSPGNIFLGFCYWDCSDDFWSVATHEFGHTMGFDHFSEADSVCPNSADRETMCPGIYQGTERQRTIEAHETQSFRDLYP